MKTTILAMLLLLTSTIMFGQKTEYGSYSLIGSKEKIVTSFISFDGNLGNLTNEFKFTDKMIGTVGCTLGSTIDHAITIGLTGSYYFDTPISKFKDFGYVGGLLEPTIFGKFPFHITFPCVIGVYGSMQEDDYWNLVVGEYMNKGKQIGSESFNHKFVIFDILVYDSKYLIGTTVEDRIELLDKLFGTISENEYLYKITDTIYRVKTFKENLKEVWDKIMKDHPTDKSAYEGLVFKKAHAKLMKGLTQTNNNIWHLKCRRETKNYKY